MVFSDSHITIFNFPPTCNYTVSFISVKIRSAVSASSIPLALQDFSSQILIVLMVARITESIKLCVSASMCWYLFLALINVR